MSSLLAPEVTTTSSEVDTLIHIYCVDCFPNTQGRYIAYCGSDVTNSEEVEEDTADCVVCRDLEYCPICDKP